MSNEVSHYTLAYHEAKHVYESVKNGTYSPRTVNITPNAGDYLLLTCLPGENHQAVAAVGVFKSAVPICMGIPGNNGIELTSTTEVPVYAIDFITEVEVCDYQDFSCSQGGHVRLHDRADLWSQFGIEHDHYEKPIKSATKAVKILDPRERQLDLKRRVKSVMKIDLSNRYARAAFDRKHGAAVVKDAIINMTADEFIARFS